MNYFLFFRTGILFRLYERKNREEKNHFRSLNKKNFVPLGMEEKLEHFLEKKGRKVTFLFLNKKNFAFGTEKRETFFKKIR